MWRAVFFEQSIRLDVRFFQTVILCKFSKFESLTSLIKFITSENVDKAAVWMIGANAVPTFAPTSKALLGFFKTNFAIFFDALSQFVPTDFKQSPKASAVVGLSLSAIEFFSFTNWTKAIYYFTTSRSWITRNIFCGTSVTATDTRGVGFQILTAPLIVKVLVNCKVKVDAFPLKLFFCDHHLSKIIGQYSKQFWIILKMFCFNLTNTL